MSDPERPVGATAIQRSLAALEAGRTDAAAKGFENVLTYDPENGEAHYFLAVIAYQDGRAAVALERIERAVTLRPDAADCHNLHGLILLALNKPSEAVTALRQALACDDAFPDACNNLGAAYEALGSLDDAETSYLTAIAADPASAQAHSNLSRILLATGRPVDAEAACRAALSARPDLADARFNLAVAQQRQGKLGEAEATIDAARAAAPHDANLWRFLGALRHSGGYLSGAETALRKAISLSPELSETHDNLAGVLLDQGRVGEAEASFERALELNPQDNRTHSNLLLCRNYYETDPDALFGAHKAWAAQHAKEIVPLPASARTPSDRLRIGYVSGDFRRHSVAYFLEPLLQYRDRDRFENFCYANLENPDAVTDRLRNLSDQWRWVAGLNDHRLAETIREDQIDILVDLSGHTAGNRLPVFASKPAPVQVTWLGYPNTTGLETIDYRITDAVADPEGAERHATETLFRLEDSFLCYRPPGEAPETAPSPARRNGYVTFGSFNNLRKITPETIETWSEILNSVPDSKLQLKARPLADPETADRFQQSFAARGVDSERVVVRGAVASSTDHLAAYADIDIALDPFPYNGTTTSCEALWMGVPVITKYGNRHAGRVGTSLLASVGLTDFICADRRAYVETASALAQDLQGLTDLRATLRDCLAASSLCDEVDFCRRMEDAFNRMWRGR